MCILHKQHPQGVALQATCIQPEAGQDRLRRWVPRCLRQDRPKGERLVASPLRGYAATLSQRGISLIELIMFIMIVSVALAGILLVMNVTTKNSADPLIHKQALAIAESMLEEVELMPFTYCDPDDANATTATAPVLGAGGCATMVENLGVENDVSRYDPAFPYDNVSDYNNFSMAAGSLLDITGAAVGSAGYGVTVAVANNGMPAAGASPAIANTEALLITVTVTGPDLVPVVLEGIRTRYSPKAVP